METIDDRLVEAWMLAVLLLSLKMIGVAQLTGSLRLLQGSFVTVEGERCSSLSHCSFLSHCGFTPAAALSRPSPPRVDFEVMRATFGPPPEAVPKSFGTAGLRRLRGIHRNDMENIPLFFALSAAYIATRPPVQEARVLIAIFVVTR